MEKRITLKKLGKKKVLLKIGDIPEGIYTPGTLYRAGIRDGESLEEADVENLYLNFIIPYAKERVLRLLSKRDRSEFEIRRYLEEKKYSSWTIDRVVEDFKRSLLINDRRFAENFVITGYGRNPKGKKLLEVEMKQRGLNEEIITEVLSEYHEKDALKEAYERAVRRYHNQKEKIIKYLLRRGFDYYDILDLLREE